MNPNGTVPVIRDGEGQPLWETGAILRYLAGKYGADEFWPQDPERRAETDKWTEWAKISVAMNFTAPVFWMVVRTAAKDQDHQALEKSLQNLNKKLAIAEAQIAGMATLPEAHSHWPIFSLDTVCIAISILPLNGRPSRLLNTIMKNSHSVRHLRNM